MTSYGCQPVRFDFAFKSPILDCLRIPVSLERGVSKPLDGTGGVD